MERCGGSDEIPTRDRRLKQLGFMIEDGWEKEESLEVPKMVLQILRRVHLAELATKYMEEVEAEADQAAPKDGRQPTVKERYVNLLFPHTVKHTSKNTGKGKKSGKGKRREKGKKRRNGVVRQVSSRAQKSLHALRKGHDQAVVDYVDFCYPGLKEQISNLPWVLRGIVAGDIPTKRLVIETIPSHDLSNRPFEELFEFSSDRNSSALGEPSSEEPSQMSKQAVNTPQTGAAVGPSEQKQANEHVQGTIESVQDTQPDSTFESLQSFSPRTEIQNGSLSSPIIGYSECVHSSAYNEQSDHHEEPHRHIIHRSPFQDVDGSAQAQQSIKWGELDPQDYFIQDDDWRAQPPSCEGESPNLREGDFHRSGSSEAASYDFDSLIDYSPQTTP
ncbi:hypothetical protein BKA65DRAFT_486019 [Rhexocercosporidium sp. MPI-PUGE-AT-0058]|nr:hypothetical protein BKA65DRAFT_486019 [Rhexocercosporidium sp. MPI-PUGE-AT-0058]